MKTMAKRSSIVLDDDILLFQILPRLPAMSLGRFKCVCKQWRSFLTTPMFTKMHIHHVNDQNHHKLLVVPITKSCPYFRTIDCGTTEVGLSANRSLPFEANSKEVSIISSLNGLVCVGINYLYPRIGPYSDIILWNPLTGEYKTLSKDNSHANCFTIPASGYGFYYNSRDDDYNLLRVTKSGDAYIYSLKSDSWRKVASTCCRTLKGYGLYQSCLLNENLYFFAKGRITMYGMDLRLYSIVRFDTKVENFTEIATPSLDNLAISCFGMTVVSGCLHLCVSSVEIRSLDKLNKLELWKMDGDGEWTKVVSCCHTLFKREFYHPLHLMKNGIWLVASRGEGCAYEVDLEMKTTKKVCTYTSTTDGPMDILWGGKFVETIVSLNK